MITTLAQGFSEGQNRIEYYDAPPYYYAPLDLHKNGMKTGDLINMHVDIYEELIDCSGTKLDDGTFVNYLNDTKARDNFELLKSFRQPFNTIHVLSCSLYNLGVHPKQYFKLSVPNTVSPVTYNEWTRILQQQAEDSLAQARAPDGWLKEGKQAFDPIMQFCELSAELLRTHISGAQRVKEPVSGRQKVPTPKRPHHLDGRVELPFLSEALNRRAPQWN